MPDFNNPDEIFTALVTHPGYTLMHPTKNELYVLHPSGYVLVMSGRDVNLHALNEVEVNSFIQAQFV